MDGDEDPALDNQGTKLEKCPEKAKLFEAICKLFKPLTDIAYECPKLLGPLAQLHFRRAFWQKTRQNRQINLPPPKAQQTGARLRPRSDGSGKRPPTPPRVKRVRPVTSSSVRGSPPKVVPPPKREPKRRKEPHAVPVAAKIEGTSPKAEVKQVIPRRSVGRSKQLILASKKRKAAKASTFSKKSCKAAAKKVKEEVAEPVEAPPKYLKPTPKVRASSANIKEKAPKRRRKSKAGNEDLSSAEVEPVKSELDCSPLEEKADYGANAKGVKAEAPPESSESEDDSQESEQEVTDERLTAQFNRLKASVKPKEKPPAGAVNTAGPPTDVEETGNQPVKPHGNIGRHQENLVAILKLGSPCQGLSVLEDRLQSNRLPGDRVIIHGNRHAIELKILMHRQGHKLRLVQGDKEVEDDALAGDPRVPCMLSPHTLRFVSCIHPEAQHSIVVLDLEGTPLVFPEPRGARIEQIRRAFRLGPEVTMTGFCGCQRHFVQVEHGAFVPWGATLIQWTRP